MIQKLFVPYHLALLAKEKGFNEPCFAFWERFTNKICYNQGIKNSNGLLQDQKEYTLPLYQQLVDWFREEHSIEIMPGLVPKIPREMHPEIFTGKFNFYLYNENWNPTIPSRGSFSNTYYEALTKILEEAFKLI